MDEQEKLNRAMKAWKCTECECRIDAIIMDGHRSTNLGTRCSIGYLQNPRTVEATKNLIANGGTLCLRHPMKYL